MKNLKMLGMAMTLVFSVNAMDKVVYGEDDRRDLYEVSNSLHLELARSTAAMIAGYKVKITANGSVELKDTKTLAQRGICSDERFSEQVTSANCSGFLVGEDLLVTAGHCIKTQSDCEANKWVFDFAYHSNNTNEVMELNESSVYGCKEIIERDLNRSDNNDYALIRLDRKVTDRDPLKFRTNGQVKEGADLVVIGHPTGLPTKVADGATVRSNPSSRVYFTANLDTFGGNSGSAVFDANTGVVEGILVRGETDYKYDWNKGCRVVYKCSDNGCRGEDVTKITNIKALSTL
ncbi:MAG: serine protease [Bdellovibrionota bacterium]|nr:serine protease [Bdellovibrionota bacterium]